MSTNTNNSCLCSQLEQIHKNERDIATMNVYVKILIGIASLMGANLIILVAFLLNEYIRK